MNPVILLYLLHILRGIKNNTEAGFRRAWGNTANIHGLGIYVAPPPPIHYDLERGINIRVYFI